MNRTRKGRLKQRRTSSHAASTVSVLSVIHFENLHACGSVGYFERSKREREFIVL
jgi:hypothetical protein